MVGFGEKDLNRLKPYFEYLGFQVVFAEHQSQLLEIAKRFDLVCLPEEALTLSNLSEYKALSGKCLVIQQQLFSAQESLLSETDFCLTDPFRLSDLIDCLRLIYVGERHKIGGMTLQVSPKPAEGKNLNGRQVLFVEDNCVHAEITQRIIAQSGMTGHWLNPNRLNYIDLKQSQDGLPKSISEPISDYL